MTSSHADSSIQKKDKTQNQSKPGKLIAIVAGALVAVLAAVGAIWYVFSPKEAVEETQVGGGTLTVSAAGIDLKISDVAPEADAVTELEHMPVGDYLVSAPISISTTGTIGSSGVNLQFEMAAPLPAGMHASFAYFDEEYEMWVPEVTRVSEDRLSLTSTVHHLSDWVVIFTGSPGVLQDFVGTVGQMAAGAVEFIVDVDNKVNKIREDLGAKIAQGYEATSNQLYRFTHELSGSAVGLPTCNAQKPGWLLEASTSLNTEIEKWFGLGTEGINAVLMCSGTDESGENLVVKVNANRGYGFAVEMPEAIKPRWSFASLSEELDGVVWNEGIQHESSLFAPAQSVLDFLYAVSEKNGSSILPYHPRLSVPAVGEVTYTLDRATFEEYWHAEDKESDNGRIIEVITPNLWQFLISVGIKLATDVGADAFDKGADAAEAGAEVIEEFDDLEVFSALAALYECTVSMAETNEAAAELTSDEQVIEAANMLTDCIGIYEPEEMIMEQLNIANAGKAVKRLAWIPLLAQAVFDYIGDVTTDVISGVPAGFAHAIGVPKGSIIWADLVNETCWHTMSSRAGTACVTVATVIGGTVTSAFTGPNLILGNACTQLEYNATWLRAAEQAWYCPAGVPFEIDGKPVDPGVIAGAVTVFSENPLFNCEACGASNPIVGGGDDIDHGRIYAESVVAVNRAGAGYEHISGWSQVYWLEAK